VVNGLGEIMKLALVRSQELFLLLEAHGARLVRERFQGQDGVADRVMELSIQIMLEELGPNLWEERLERCLVPPVLPPSLPPSLPPCLVLSV
jgi:3-dehydroquinate synthase